MAARARIAHDRKPIRKRIFASRLRRRNRPWREDSGFESRLAKSNRPTHRIANSLRGPIAAIGPNTSATYSRPRARLGPLSLGKILANTRSRRFCRDCLRRGNHPTGWHGGFPTGRPWVLAQDTGKFGRQLRRPDHPASRFPDPFLGSSTLRLPLPACWPALGPTPRGLRVSHPAVRGVTGGDSSPDRPSGVLAPIGWGQPCRWPPVPAAPAIGCFARLICEDRTPSREPSPFSTFTFMPVDAENLITFRRKTEDKKLLRKKLSTAARNC